ncbi:hypothetical protein QE152_g35281 [Popillia japonica]|uniref:Uncharacterized protein n=1 Tax=Popillia japonica TaxID=7064 RepID=A0AAW1IFV5_POPJA
MSRLALVALLCFFGLAAANMPSKDYPTSSITLPGISVKPLPIEIPGFETEVAPEDEAACDDEETVELPVVIIPKPQPDNGFIPGELVKPEAKPEETEFNPSDLVKPVPKPEESEFNPSDLVKPVPKPEDDEVPCVIEETPIIGVQPPTIDVEKPTVGIQPPTIGVELPIVEVEPPAIAVEPPTIDPDYIPENIWITS